MTVPVWMWGAAAGVGGGGAVAVVFGLGLGLTSGWTSAGQFYAGFLTEYSLSLDNLFIFFVIMGWLAVPAARQQRVLLYGIVLALVLRTVLIVAGTAAINRFDWLFYPLGGFLLWTAFGLIRGRTDNPAEQQPGRVLQFLQRRLVASRYHHRLASPMILLVVTIAVADVLFAFDSIP